MKIALVQDLDAKPRAAWPFLVDPDKMNRWSLARIELLAPGDGGTAWGVGALRRIHLKTLGREVAFDEVVATSDAPSRFVYRVFRGLPLKDHRGEIRLEPRATGSRLTWDVDFDFLAPGMGFGARGVLEKQLKKSLETLAALTRGAPELELAPDRQVDAGVDLAPLWEAAERIRVAQRELADRLELKHDPKLWFTRVYQYVTEGQLDFCRSGEARHVAWVLRLIPRFHRYYTRSLFAALGEGEGALEQHWRTAFRGIDRASEIEGSEGGPAIALGILRGARAHIEEDLPRALADVYLAHYQDQCDYVRLRADYLRMAGIFRDASKRMIATMPRSYLPRGVRELYPVMPDSIKEAVFRRVFYDVPRARLTAFERGEHLVSWRQARGSMAPPPPP